MNHQYPRHTPPPSSVKTAEFVGTIGDIDVWWNPPDNEYWYNIPGDVNNWTDAGRMPRKVQLQPAFHLAEAHRLFTNQ